ARNQLGRGSLGSRESCWCRDPRAPQVVAKGGGEEAAAVRDPGEEAVARRREEESAARF
ncbi:hypothetical protein E2562_013589, partial [Oryza meyeriana var. granulata]